MNSITERHVITPRDLFEAFSNPENRNAKFCPGFKCEVGDTLVFEEYSEGLPTGRSKEFEALYVMWDGISVSVGLKDPAHPAERESRTVSSLQISG